MARVNGGHLMRQYIERVHMQKPINTIPAKTKQRHAVMQLTVPSLRFPNLCFSQLEITHALRTAIQHFLSETDTHRAFVLAKPDIAIEQTVRSITVT